MALPPSPSPAPGVAWELGRQACQLSPSSFLGVTAEDRERLVKGVLVALPQPPAAPSRGGGEMGQEMGPVPGMAALGTLTICPIQ